MCWKDKRVDVFTAFDIDWAFMSLCKGIRKIYWDRYRSMVTPYRLFMR